MIIIGYQTNIEQNANKKEITLKLKRRIEKFKKLKKKNKSDKKAF